MRVTPEDGIVVVTGAGSGLGRALAHVFAHKGFAVAGLGRRAEALEETAALCPGFFAVPVDIADAGAVRAAFATLPAPAVLVNNAAIYPRRDLLAETGESWAETVNSNLNGLVNCTLAALGPMVQRGQGRILNVATFADLNPLPGAAAYSVSKGAARIFTRALIADITDRFPGIVVSDWMPGMLATKMGIRDGLDPATAAAWGATLALLRDPSLTGSTFEMDREILPPRGLKNRVKDALLLRRRRPRVLSDL
ncbi:SDR family oxidoreductase [Sagittula salina]|uniref:SDR family NAD(P)-dependent oxidoreductase n=1 Tax=Sagittula salina TaxID=2820268 RepID=A0A940MLZ8_9RHOB|nr:SDR family NAD(P)-dependent oxidoreductase [Sagittula salina]MBP0484315.1 SDR family NAD(P)-dependent oxidoreductase [Sagittula salina]